MSEEKPAIEVSTPDLVETRRFSGLDPVKRPSHDWPEDGEHLWGKWFPNAPRSIRRACVHPDCSEVEIKDVL